MKTDTIVDLAAVYVKQVISFFVERFIFQKVIPLYLVKYLFIYFARLTTHCLHITQHTDIKKTIKLLPYV